MNDERMSREIREAIQAGERALFSLRAAAGQLSSARGWGIVDLFGGGFFTNVMKHSRIEDASGNIEQAKRDLQIFQRELRDVTVMPVELNVEIGGFLSFADFFFDGLVADYLVQSRINEAKAQVEDTIQRVELLLQKLRTYY